MKNIKFLYDEKEKVVILKIEDIEDIEDEEFEIDTKIDCLFYQLNPYSPICKLEYRRGFNIWDTLVPQSLIFRHWICKKGGAVEERLNKLMLDSINERRGE